ncbi:MAG: hypothetical protein LBF54_04120 [Holosporaceae bacterium]|nr:hypothetical protein [Holosporaceae bacterium]
MKREKAMVDKNSEMSLDDVLSSIKKMVIDDEPPVLDLTDMVKPDGSVVKIKAADSEHSDIGAFLKLVQKNADSISERKHQKEEYIAQHLQKAPIISTDVSSCPTVSKTEENSSQPNGNETILELLKEVAIPLLDKWAKDNLPDIAKNIMEEKFRELLKRVIIEK